jgi:spermidine/putrescine transport system permease protein
MKLVNQLCGGWTVLIFIFLYLPILLLVVYSFNESDIGVNWTGFTLQWYDKLRHNESLIDTVKNSLIIASITTVLSVLLGTIGAWLLYRYRFPFLKSITALIYVPVAIPEIIMGISLLVFFALIFGPLNAWLAKFSEVEAGFGFTTVIIAHTTFCFPFVLIAVQARLAGVDPFLEEAALDLGAPPLKAFWLVMVPYLLPAIVSGALMAFTLSLDEYIVTLFTYGPECQTLTIKVFGLAKKGLDPSLNAISTVFILATVVLVVLSEAVRKINR